MNEFCCLSPDEWIESGVTVTDNTFKRASGFESTLEKLDALENEKKELEMKADLEFLKANNLGKDYIKYITTKVKHCYRLLPEDTNIIPVIECYKTHQTHPLGCYCKVQSFADGVRDSRRMYVMNANKALAKTLKAPEPKNHKSPIRKGAKTRSNNRNSGKTMEDSNVENQ